MVNSNQELVESIKSFVAGWVAGCAGLIVSQPIDTIKVREQAMGESLTSAIRAILRHEGFIGLYKGILAPLIIIGPSNAVFFCIYSESMRLMDRYTKPQQDISVKDWIGRVTLAGAVAGFVQVVVTCPAEVIKVVVQTRDWKDTHATTPYGIWKESGYKGFYRGFVPMLYRCE